MTINFLDACRFLAASPGSGPFVVGSAVTGYQLPSAAGAVNGATYRYRAESSDLTQWEVGYGVYTSGSSTLTRANVLFSSNSNALVAFASAPQVAVVYLAEDVLSAQNNLSDLASITTARANLGVSATGADTTYAFRTNNLSDLSSISAARANLGNLREVLIAPRTYFVSTTGSDSNNGLTSGTSFLTIQHAINTVAGLDLGGQNVTISVAAGTYTGGVVVSAPWVGAGTVALQGDTTTPSNVFINTVSACIFLNGGGVNITLQGFRFSSTGTHCLDSNYNSNISVVGKVEFTASTGAHIHCARGGTADISGIAYTITGGADKHYWAEGAGAAIKAICVPGKTITITSSPFFVSAFAQADSVSSIEAFGQTFSGSVSGLRYSVNINGAINTFGSGASYFPGSSPGTTSLGGEYA